MDLGLKNATVLITGASKGIGRAIAGAFAAEGSRIALCARSADALQAVADDLAQRHGVEVLAVPADLSTETGVGDLVSQTLQRFGRVEVLINNAGAIRAGGLLDKPDADWQTDWNLKLFGYVRLMRAIFPLMQQAGGGRIVNIIGSGGRMPSAGYLAGGAGNAALMNITKGVAEQGAPHKILVNAINPGPVRTERWQGLIAGLAQRDGRTPQEVEQSLLANTPLGRPAEPEEIAAVTVFLASAPASYITGEIVQVDGGAANCL